MNPALIQTFRDQEMTQKERCQAFNYKFPDAPELSLTCLRKFYQRNGISP